MDKKQLRILTLVLVVFMLLTVIVGCSKQEEKDVLGTEGDKFYTLKMSTQLADTHPMVSGFKELSAKLEEKSNGRLIMEVYTSAQLGSDEDVIEQAIQGTNVAVLTDAGRMGNYVKDMGIIGMAYFADDYEDILKVTKGETFVGWEEELANDHEIRVLSFNWYDGARHFLTNKPVIVPEDLNGIRIRTPGAPVWAESVKSLGATPVAMPWTEVYPAVQQKAIDGAEAQHTASYTSRVYEVLKYINKTSHFQLINGIIVGEKWFTTLPKDLQDLLLNETKIVAEENAKLIADLSDEYEQKMVDEGMEVIETDLQAFKEASERAYEALGFKDLRKTIYEEIGK